MITMNALAQRFEDGLNALAEQNGIKAVFHVWGNAGQIQPIKRTGNTVTREIVGTLTRTGAANEATKIEMGANTLALDFFIPIEQRKSAAGDVPLPRIVNGQYPYLDEIISCIDEYFNLASQEEQEENGVTYSVGIRAGMSTTGFADIMPYIGYGVEVSVAIELTYVEGGLNSLNVGLTIDGTLMQIPFQNVQFGASNALETDVRAGDHRRRNFSSSTAALFSVAFPATSGAATRAIRDFIFGLEPNKAHFVSLTFADEEKHYLMLIDSPSISAQQIMNAGVSADFIEAYPDAELLNVPAAYQVGRFLVDSSAETTLSFSVTNCLAFIAGEARALEGTASVPVKPRDIAYDAAEDAYFVYLITDRAATVTGADFELVKAAKNEQ